MTGGNITPVMDTSKIATRNSRFIILNHYKDAGKSGNDKLRRFFGSVDIDGNIRIIDNLELDDPDGPKVHLGWRLLLYNCTRSGECDFYQRAIGRILELDDRPENAPIVFLHRGDEDLDKAKMVTDWRSERVGSGSSIEPELAEMLVKMKSPGIPMSRGTASLYPWAGKLIESFDALVYRATQENLFIPPDALFTTFNAISKAAFRTFGAE